MGPAWVGCRMCGGMKSRNRQNVKRDTTSRQMKKLGILLVLGLLAGCGTIEDIVQDISGGARTVRGWF